MYNLILCLLTLVASSYFFSGFPGRDDRATTLFLLHNGLLFAWWHARAWKRALFAFNLGTLVGLAALTTFAPEPGPGYAFLKMMACGGLAAALMAVIARRRRNPSPKE